MSEYPECPICLDIYGIDKNHIKAPIIFNCGDSICKECLEGIIKMSKENIMLCPCCREQIEKKQNINDYTVCKQLIKLVNSSFRLPENEEADNKDNKKDKQNIITYKIISLGDSGVGKTSIFKRLLNEKFEASYNATIYVEMLIPYFVKYKNIKYKLFFYDSGGQEKYMSGLPKSYMRQSDGVLFVFDLSNRKSFEDLNNWYKLYKNEKEKVIGVLIGNKCDNPRQVQYDEAKSFANELGLEYFETSAKLDKKIKKAIATLLEEIIESKALYSSLSSVNTEDGNENFQLDPKKLKKQSFCDTFCRILNPKNWFS